MLPASVILKFWVKSACYFCLRFHHCQIALYWLCHNTNMVSRSCHMDTQHCAHNEYHHSYCTEKTNSAIPHVGMQDCIALCRCAGPDGKFTLNRPSGDWKNIFGYSGFGCMCRSDNAYHPKYVRQELQFVDSLLCTNEKNISWYPLLLLTFI